MKNLSFIFLGATAMLAACGSPDRADDASEKPPHAADTMAEAAPSATAMLKNAEGVDVGQANLTETDGGLTLALMVKGMAEGRKGVHIHQTGDCAAPDFKTAGGHWNPMTAQHGLENPKGAHKGDLPNLEIGADGTGSLTATITGATLAGENGLFDSDGAAFVVHEGEDDQKTDPSGDSGARIACGVFAEK